MWIVTPVNTTSILVPERKVKRHHDAVIALIIAVTLHQQIRVKLSNFWAFFGLSRVNK